VTYPGDPRIGHAWAYLPDLGETFARLVDRERDLATFETFHFGGHWFERGGEIAERIRIAAGAPDAPIRRFPWPVVRALSPVVPLFREMAEIRYLWQQPLRLDNTRLRAFLGEEPHTDIDTALRTTLEGLGSMRRPRPSAAATARTASAP
jgi:nucleoside-diphosphate-sugar epimerase